MCVCVCVFRKKTNNRVNTALLFSLVLILPFLSSLQHIHCFILHFFNYLRSHFHFKIIPYSFSFIPLTCVFMYTSVSDHSTVQYSTVQHSTVQYSTVQYSTVQYRTVQYSTVQYSTVQYSTVQYRAVRL